MFHKTEHKARKAGVDAETAAAPKEFEGVARDFTLGFLETVLTDAKRGETFEELMEAQTKGGLNEQNMGIVGAQGVGAVYEQAMETALKRLGGVSSKEA